MSIFTTDEERKAAQLKYRRKALREAENAIDFVKDKIAELKKERDAKWAEAGNYLRNGQKAAAQRALTTVRGNDVILLQLDHKRWLFESIVTKMECIETDSSFAEALSTLTKVISVDPEQIAQVLDEAAGKCDELKEVDKVWNKEYSRQMNGIAASDVVPSMDEMLKDLEGSVVSGMTSKAPPKVVDQKAEKKTGERVQAANTSDILKNIERAMAGSVK